jgi:hypothetical protein
MTQEGKIILEGVVSGKNTVLEAKLLVSSTFPYAALLM